MEFLRCGIHGFHEVLGIDMDGILFYWDTMQSKRCGASRGGMLGASASVRVRKRTLFIAVELFRASIVCYMLIISTMKRDKAYRQRQSSIIITNVSSDINSRASTATAVLMKPWKEACARSISIVSSTSGQINGKGHKDPNDPWDGFPQSPHDEQGRPRQSHGRLDHEQRTCPGEW